MSNTVTITANSYDTTIDNTTYTVSIGAAVAVTKSVHTENFVTSASNLTGSDGDTGRVLSLSNTVLTKTNGFCVFLDTSFIHPTDLTVTHAATTSTVTFDNTKVWDGQKLTVIYHDA